MGSPHILQQSGVLPVSLDQEEVHGASLAGRIPCPDPPGACTWFRTRIGAKGPQDQMLEHARTHNHKFRAAFDYIPFGHDRVVKMFASYATWEDFVTGTLLKADPQDRHFYEVIPEGKPCKLYLDIEWKGTADPGKTVLRHLVDELVAYVKVRWLFSHAHQKKVLGNEIISLSGMCSQHPFSRCVIRIFPDFLC
jgi:hypothetical protein